MNNQTENKNGLRFEQQAFTITPNSCFSTNFGPLVWYSTDALSSETNTSFCAIPNYSMIFRPILYSPSPEKQKILSLGCKEDDDYDQQKIKDLQNQQQVNKIRIPRRPKVGSTQKCKIQARKKVTHKITKRYKQNPRRNIVTNIGNQLLTFASNRSKCTKALKMLFPNEDLKEMEGFFLFTGNLRSKIGYYLNYHKMKNIWYSKQLNSSSKNYQKILRKVSYFYLSQMFRPIILNSQKMNRKSKNYHMKAVRRLIRDLRIIPKPY